MKKIFAAITAIFVSFSAWAGIGLPIHMHYVNFNKGVRDTTSNSVDVRMTSLTEPPVIQGIGYYSMASMWFESGGAAYMGLQKDDYQGKKVLFSAWDTGANQVQAETPWCNRFGHEGTGAQCVMQYEWVTGHEYKFYAFIHNSTQNNRVAVSAFVIDNTAKTQKLIGTISFPDINTAYRGYGKFTAITYAMEYYGAGNQGINDCSQLPVWNVQWVSPIFDNGKRFSRATYYANPGIGALCRNENIAQAGPWTFITTTGGNTQPNVNDGYSFMNEELFTAFRQIDCFYDKIEAQFDDLIKNQNTIYNKVSQFEPATNQYYRDYSNVTSDGRREGFKIYTDTQQQDIYVIKYPENLHLYGGKTFQYVNNYQCTNVIR